MGSRNVRVVVLCEDKQQFSFAYRCLKKLGFGPRDIDRKFTALGREGGAGEQFVRASYAAEVGTLRRRHAGSALLAVIDADIGTVGHRERQLGRALSAAGLAPRTDGERIAHWIPRRNIETWIHFLLGEQVDEKSAYAKLTGRESACEPAVRRFIAIFRSRGAAPDGAPQSLLHGLRETRRIAK